LTLLICVPIPRCMPEHLIQIKIPNSSSPTLDLPPEIIRLEERGKTELDDDLTLIPFAVCTRLVPFQFQQALDWSVCFAQRALLADRLALRDMTNMFNF